MQERYCECGNKVYVAYVFTSRGIFHLFGPTARMKMLKRCPKCGKPIHIDDLC
ncbi:MAG: hypothetical protein ACOCP7_02455 [Desulfohalobiaceae bacterium]